MKALQQPKVFAQRDSMPWSLVVDQAQRKSFFDQPTYYEKTKKQTREERNATNYKKHKADVLKAINEGCSRVLEIVERIGLSKTTVSFYCGELLIDKKIVKEKAASHVYYLPIGAQK